MGRETEIYRWKRERKLDKPREERQTVEQRDRQLENHGKETAGDRDKQLDKQLKELKENDR